ncbi:PAS domain-containing protein [Aquabacterium sp.]|uniref:PAS domain-containing protein n=1 Tax=Aquabacterium sp. TaxID=1872578 RepID=UPI002D0C5771|nr:PAS domain-containing protein [Aquabacterium sp.]HSW04037.1 PAS domain-containing protein [Aquabacterium sp.]
MRHHVTAAEELAALRSRAAARLSVGGRPLAAAGGSDALAVLHALASSPDTAGDALALLHELQVHQIELDMQAEALRESRAELESALREQIALYDKQPVACLRLDGSRVVHDLNLTGAALLGIERDEAQGQALDAFLAPASARSLRDWLAAAGGGDARGVLTLQLVSPQGPGRAVTAYLRTDPTDQRCLVVLVDGGEAEAESRS